MLKILKDSRLSAPPELEKALGKKLLQRQGKELKPTADGLELAALAGGFLAGLDELGSESKPIILAGCESIIRWVVLPATLLVEAVKTRSVGALIPHKAAVELPEDEFAVLDDEALTVPPRQLALAVYAKTYNFRPRVRRAFEECHRALR